MNWDQIKTDHEAVVAEVFGRLRPEIEAFSRVVVAALRAGNKVMVCGNGGSAGDAQHIVGEFVNRFLLERKPYAAIALTTDTSSMTAIGNDYSFDQVFEKQVQALGKKGDVLLGISTSGNAANVRRAFEAARQLGITTVALTGGTGGKLAPLADRVLSISCTRHTPRIQEGHELAFHLFCELIEEMMEARNT
jgi:D-sedoheptulose 7-phosphate isomerase